MKKIFAIITLLAALALALPASAQVTSLGYARAYPLTNSTTFKLSTGYTNMANAAITTINSQPFALQPGRGFAYQLAFVATNAATLSVTPYFQLATPYYSNSVLITNWQTGVVAGTGTACNGTTGVVGYNLMPPTTVDNAVLCRLAYVSNAHTAYVSLDPTNSLAFITK